MRLPASSDTWLPETTSPVSPTSEFQPSLNSIRSLTPNRSSTSGKLCVSATLRLSMNEYEDPKMAVPEPAVLVAGVTASRSVSSSRSSSSSRLRLNSSICATAQFVPRHFGGCLPRDLRGSLEVEGPLSAAPGSCRGEFISAQYFNVSWWEADREFSRCGSDRVENSSRPPLWSERKTTVCPCGGIRQNSMHLQDFCRSPLRHLLPARCYASFNPARKDDVRLFQAVLACAHSCRLPQLRRP